MNTKIKQLVYTALFTALIYVGTASIKIPVPFTSGYIHPGDSMIFIAASLLNTPYAIFAAGVGSMLADLLSPYANWAFPTLLIKSLMALVICITIKSYNNKKVTYIIGAVGSVIWAGFSIILSIVINRSVTPESTYLLSELEDITTMEQLITNSNKLMNQLILFAVLIPIIIIILLFIVNKRNNLKLTFPIIIGMTMAGLTMVIGYYFAATIMYGSYITPIFSIPWNMAQFTIGFLIAILLLPVIRKVYLRNNQ